MRLSITLAASLFLVGCATHPVPKPVVQQQAEALPAKYEEAAAATALVFDPPFAGEHPIELTRDERQPAAFVGWDGPITTSFWIYTDDWQDSGGFDRGGRGLRSNYQRDAQISQIGVRTR